MRVTGLRDVLYTNQLVSLIPSMFLSDIMCHGMYISVHNDLSFNIFDTDGLDSLHVQALEINSNAGLLARKQSGIYLYARHCLNKFCYKGFTPTIY